MSNLTSTSDQILHVARTLMIAGGYNGFSYADIAKVVGIRNASIHHHFPSKADLVRSLVARYRQEAESGLVELSRTIADPLGQLQAYLGYWESCILDDTAPFCICALLAGEAQLLPDEVRLEVRAHFSTLSSWLTRTMQQGVRENALSLTAPPEAEAEVFLATVHGAMLSARAYGNPAIFTTIKGALLQRLAANT